MDRTDLRSSYKSGVEEFEVGRIQELESKRDLRKSGPPSTPATSSARSATGCLVHGTGFLPTTSPNRGDETRSVDRSVNDSSVI